MTQRRPDRRPPAPDRRAGCPVATGARLATLALLGSLATATPSVAQTTTLDAVRLALAPDVVLTWRETNGSDDDALATDVTLRPFGADDQSPWLAVGQLRLVGADEDRQLAGFLPWFDLVELSDVRLYASDGRGSARIDSIVIEEVLVPAGFVADIVLSPEDDGEDAEVDEPDTDDTEGDDDAADAEAADPPPVLTDEGGPIAEQLSDMVIGSFVASNIRQVEPAGGMDRETLQLAEIRLTDVADGRIAEVSASGLAIDTVQGSLDLDLLRLTRFDMVTTAAVAEAIYDLDFPDDDDFTFDPGLELVEFAGLTMIGPNDETLLTLERFAVEDIRRIGGDIVDAHIMLDDLAMPVAAVDDAAVEDALNGMGYGDLGLSMEFRATLDPEAETLTVAPVIVDLDDMAELSITFSMGNFILDEMVEQLRQLGGPGLPTLPRATFAGFELQLRDDGLTERLLAYTAQHTEGGRQAIIDGVAAAVGGLLEEQRITGDLHDQAVGAVIAFLEDPARLIVRAVPATPVSLLELGIGFVAAPESTMNRLGAEVLHEDRP